MSLAEIKYYLKSLIHKSGNKEHLNDIIESLSLKDLTYAYSYITSIEKASGKESVSILDIQKSDVLYIRLECFVQINIP